MKRSLCILLVSVIIFVSIVTVLAEENDSLLFKDKFVSSVPNEEDDEYDYSDEVYQNAYDELYYHYDENGDIDWAIVFASFSTMPGMLYACVDNYIIESGTCGPFALGFGVYDVKKDSRIDMEEAWNMDYEGLRDEFVKVLSNSFYDSDARSVFREGRVGVNLLGDTDCDQRLTIKDANLIQRHLVGIYIQSIKDGAYEFMSCIFGDTIVSCADINRDCEVNINDVTTIQLRLLNQR